MLLEFETEKVGRMAREDKRVRNALVKAFSDPSETIRERALLAAADMNDPNIVDEVVKSLDDDEVDVRIAAAQTLAWYHQPKTIPDLLKGLKDGNTWVRSHCAAGLSKLVSGPIWARLPEEDIETIMADFPEMVDDEIRTYLLSLKVRPKAIDQYMRWRKEEFDIEVDVEEFIEDMETPIILEEKKDALEPPSPKKGPSLDPEVEEILSELPNDTREALPIEDIRRLTAKTARELVDSLQEPSDEKAKKKPAKKKVKVRKVKRVKRVRKGPTRKQLLAKIPKEVLDSVPEETLNDLSIEELEALVGSAEDAEDQDEKDKLISELPDDVRESMTDAAIAKLTRDELQELVKSSKEEESDELVQKYGRKKARLLRSIPEDVLAGIPEDQIREMDEESLKGLADAMSHE